MLGFVLTCSFVFDKTPNFLSVKWKHEDGRVVSLSNLSVEQRSSLADQLLTRKTKEKGRSHRCKVVHRHAKNGDWVLMNRQPSLHKASIMAFQVRTPLSPSQNGL